MKNYWPLVLGGAIVLSCQGNPDATPSESKPIAETTAQMLTPAVEPDKVVISPPAANTATRKTEIRAYDALHRAVNANCVMQNGEELSTFSTPAVLSLPVGTSGALKQILITCKYNEMERTAILTSRPASAQSNVAVDANSGNALLTSEFNSDVSTSGIASLSDAVVLGLSTSVITGNFFIYPSLATLNF